MLKLPANLPPLEEPAFVLANPLWMQLAVVAGACLVVPLAVLAGLSVVLVEGRADGGHWALAGLMAILLGGGLFPRNWRRWVVFAADRRGVYIGTWRGQFHFVPWIDVGPSEIGLAGIGSNRQRTVILPLRLDDARWAELLGGRRRRVNAPADAAGFRPFGIGNAAQDVAATQRRIEALRPR